MICPRLILVKWERESPLPSPWKFSFILFRAHPLILLAMMVLVIGGLALALTMPALVIIIPGAVFFGTTFLMESVFLKHMRPEDLERIQREKEEKDE